MKLWLRMGRRHEEVRSYTLGVALNKLRSIHRKNVIEISKRVTITAPVRACGEWIITGIQTSELLGIIIIIKTE